MIAKFSVACTATYNTELEIPDEISSDKEKTLEYIRNNLDRCPTGELTWISDNEPEDAVVMEDIKGIYDNEPISIADVLYARETYAAFLGIDEHKLEQLIVQTKENEYATCRVAITPVDESMQIYPKDSIEYTLYRYPDEQGGFRLCVSSDKDSSLGFNEECNINELNSDSLNVLLQGYESLINDDCEIDRDFIVRINGYDRYLKRIDLENALNYVYKTDHINGLLDTVGLPEISEETVLFIEDILEQKREENYKDKSDDNER